MFDTVVLVVRAGVTSLDAVRASLKFLDQEPVVILNGTKSSVPRWLASGEGSSVWLLLLLAVATAVGLSSVRLETKGAALVAGATLTVLGYYTLKSGAL